MSESVDVVIINWNAGMLLKQCVESLVEPGAVEEIKQIFIIDNASQDNSLSSIPTHPKIVLIRNTENRGFSAACNMGFKHCTARFTLLLNPDTIMFKDTLIKCRLYMEEHADIDIMGIQLLTRNGKISKSCARFPTPLRFLFDSTGLSLYFPGIFTPALLMTDWDHASSRWVDQVMGAFMYMPSEIFQKIGYFDERFFVYFEELDFCKRLSEAQGKIWFNADIQSCHIGMGTTANITTYRLFLSLSSRLKYSQKHFSRAGHLMVLFSTFVIEPFARTFHSLFLGRTKEVVHIWKAYILLLKKRFRFAFL